MSDVFFWWERNIKIIHKEISYKGGTVVSDPRYGPSLSPVNMVMVLGISEGRGSY